MKKWLHSTYDNNYNDFFIHVTSFYLITHVLKQQGNQLPIHILHYVI